MACDRLEPLVTNPYDVRYLSEPEIAELIAKLEQHSSLGFLFGKSQEEKRNAFVDRAGRQLLVALLEATSGVPLEDILVDEYKHIVPEAAQALYLTVCVLNRIRVPVRTD